MDFFEYTDIRFLVDSLHKWMVLPFLLGAVYGGLLGAGIAMKKWAIPAVLVLLPATLAVMSFFISGVHNATYRLFFLGVPALAVLAFAYWLTLHKNK